MLNSKKLTATVLIAALSVSSLVVAPHAAQAKTFSDVSKNHWAYNVIDEVSNKGAMNGTAQNIFSPNKVLTRVEYTTILYNLSPDKHSSPTFGMSDLSTSDWFYDAAKWGVSNGIIYPSYGKFAGNEKVDRQYMAFMTYNFLNKYYPNALNDALTAPSFSDSNQVGENYQKAVQTLAANKLIFGYGDHKFAPKATLTRAEAAAMASRVMEVARNNETVPPAKPNPPSKPTEPQQPEKPNKPTVPEKPPVNPKPEKPQKPEQPPVEEAKPFPGDENAPEWLIKVKIDNGSYTYVTKPDSMTKEQWEELKAYFRDKKKPGEYPTSVSRYADPQAYMSYHMEQLYKYVQRDKAKEALEAGTIQLSAEEQKMVDLVNAERRKAGVPELKVSPKLCEAAQIRAKEVTLKPTHERPDGTNCSSVLNDVNLNFYGLNNVSLIGFGENLTVRSKGNFPSEDGFNNFLGSSGHKENMLNEHYEYIGIAQYRATNGKTSWIQVFGQLQ